MNQYLEKSKGLNETQYSQIRQLEAQCNQFDGLAMKLNLNTLRHRPDDEVNDFLFYNGAHLVGFMALYIFNAQEVEISAMTHPDYRRQGIFSRLLAAAREEVQRRKVPDFLFICERASAAAQPVMQAIGAEYEFSEYKMVLQEAKQPAGLIEALELRPASARDLDDLIEMDAISFGIERDGVKKRMVRDLADPNRRIWVASLDGVNIGKINISATEAETFITAFSVLPDYRGQGYGKTILSRLVETLSVEQHQVITLEVETKNDNALSIYINSGFEVTTAYDYYRLPTSNASALR